jgi:hypothetical protein
MEQQNPIGWQKGGGNCYSIHPSSVMLLRPRVHCQLAAMTIGALRRSVHSADYRS